jgi:hypothetical protein
VAATVVSNGIPIEPVALELVRRCAYKQQPCQLCGKAKTNKVHRKEGGSCPYKRKIGCARCGKPKKDLDHFGAPPSLNVFGSGNMGAFIGLKAQWEEVMTDLLEASSLPKGLDSVNVEAEIVFPDDGARYKRDEGNLRFLIEKSLGDALVAGGWLGDDSFYPVRRYSFGSIQPCYEEGVSALRLMIFSNLSSGSHEIAIGDPGLERAAAVGASGLSVDVQVAGGDAEHNGVSRVAGAEKFVKLG